MKDPHSSRSVLITIADGKKVEVDVSQPSDCLLLQREHVQRTEIDLLVYFGHESIETINGPSEHQPPETWQQALHHLLDTYRPGQCYVHTEGFSTGIEDGHQVELADGKCYRAYWNMTCDILSIAR